MNNNEWMNLSDAPDDVDVLILLNNGTMVVGRIHHYNKKTHIAHVYVKFNNGEFKIDLGVSATVCLDTPYKWRPLPPPEPNPYKSRYFETWEEIDA